MLPYGVAALLYGPLTRRFEPRNIKLFCLSIFSLSNIVAGLSTNIYILFIARFLSGFFGAAIIPLALILIAQNTQSEQRGRSVGTFFSITYLSSLLGLFLSGIIFWRWIFLLPGLIGILLCLLIKLYFPVFNKRREPFKLNYRFTLSNRKVFRLFVYIFFISLFYHGVRQWLGVFFSKEYYFSQFLISMLLTVVSLSGIFGESFGGFLADRLGRIKIINIGISLMIFAIFSLLLKSNFVILFLIMFIWGLGWTFNHAGVSTVLTDLPKEHLIESASLNSSVRFISGGLGVALGGFLMQQSFTTSFVIYGFLLVGLLFSTKNLLVKQPSSTS